MSLVDRIIFLKDTHKKDDDVSYKIDHLLKIILNKIIEANNDITIDNIINWWNVKVFEYGGIEFIFENRLNEFVDLDPFWNCENMTIDEIENWLLEFKNEFNTKTRKQIINLFKKKEIKINYEKFK